MEDTCASFIFVFIVDYITLRSEWKDRFPFSFAEIVLEIMRVGLVNISKKSFTILGMFHLGNRSISRDRRNIFSHRPFES